MRTQKSPDSLTQQNQLRPAAAAAAASQSAAMQQKLTNEARTAGAVLLH
jgi:hypothetical protein